MKKQKTIVDFIKILDDVHYQGWDFEVHEQSNGETYLQLNWVDDDADTGKVSYQSSRKWKLSAHMTRSEVVQTAFKAVLTAEEHEVRERFMYRNKPVFGPHLDIDALWEIAYKRDVRDSL